MKIFKKLLVSSTALFLTAPVLADLADNVDTKISNKPSKGFLVAQNNESDSDTLKITVTGSRTPRPVDTFPGSINVLDQDDLSNRKGNTIRDLTDDIPGVTTKATQRSGVKGPTDAGNVNIRGLDFNRVLFLVDGIRLPEPYKYETYYNFSQGSYVDFNTLTSVEILKGPASALYGADALAGLISYRSLKASDLLEDGQNQAFEIPVNYSSSNDGTDASIKYATRLGEKNSLALVYTREDSGALNVKADDKFKDDETNFGNNIFLNLTTQINDFSEINTIFENVSRESNSVSTDDNLLAMNSSYTTYKKLESDTTTDRERYSISYNYNNPNNDKLIKSVNLKLYKQDSYSEDNFDRTTTARGSDTLKEHRYYLENYMSGAEIQLQSKFNDHQITYGIDYSLVDTERLRTTTTIGGSTVKEKDTPDTEIKRTGVYLQDEVSYGKFDFIAGIRYDSYDLDAKTDSVYTTEAWAADLNESSISPKIAATYSINDKLSAYGQYSKGFRAPAYYEVNGDYSNPSRGYTVKSNPDLDPETSDSYEIGFRGRYKQLDFNLAGFYNKYENFIEQFKLTGKNSANLDLYQSVNVSKAEISGVEFDTEYYLNPARYGVSLFGSLAYAEGNNETDDEPLTSINPFEAKIGIKYSSEDDKWNTRLTNTFVGEPRVADNTTTFVPDEYMTTDATISYKPNNRYELSTGIYNIFDEKYYNYQDVQGKSKTLSNLTRFTQPARNVQVGFKVKF